MRMTLAGVLGTVVAALLFFLMQGLIQQAPAKTGPITCGIDLIHRVIPPEPPKPPKRLKPPEPPEPVDNVLAQPAIEMPPIDVAPKRPELGGEVFVRSARKFVRLSFQQPDGGPVLRFGAVKGYPIDAARNGVEGWIEVEFSVLINGSVGDVSIVDEEPRGVFGRHARQSVSRWKFTPRYVDGQPVETRIRQIIRYELHD